MLNARVYCVTDVLKMNCLPFYLKNVFSRDIRMKVSMKKYSVLIYFHFL